MSRAEQMKPGDVSLGQAYEFFKAFGAAGGNTAMLQQTIEDPSVMQRVIDAFKGETQPVLEQGTVMQALMVAVEKGVQCENGVYRFFDPGIPLVVLRNLSVVRQQKLIFAQDWYDQCDWAKCEDAPQERTLRIPVESPFNKTFLNQEKLLTAEEEVASTRSVVMFLIINALSTGKRLLPDYWVRCIDKGSDGRRVSVGGFDADGLKVLSNWDGYCSSGIGVAAARKS